MTTSTATTAVTCEGSHHAPERVQADDPRYGKCPTCFGYFRLNLSGTLRGHKRTTYGR